MGCQLVVDKSPRNSLRVPFIRRIFPEARYIYIIRDGRDVTLSINKEWIRRRQIVQGTDAVNKYDYGRVYGVLKEWLHRQPSLAYRIRALWFETHGHVMNKSLHLNLMRWNGRVGWGPRFRNWQDVLAKTSLLQFNAYQWSKCIENIQHNWKALAREKKLMIRYEDLLKDGRKLVTEILDFLNLRGDEKFFRAIPRLKKDNVQKWQREFSRDDLQEIHPIVTPMLMELGYEVSHSWLNQE